MEDDVKRLKRKVYDKIPGYMIQDDQKKCPFLDLKIGCTLKHEDKPLDCRMFPIAFKYKDGKATFYLNKRCKYWKEIPREWVLATKKWAGKAIAELTEEEKIEFSKMAEGYPESKLMSL